jgi:hypothetical protein
MLASINHDHASTYLKLLMNGYCAEIACRFSIYVSGRRQWGALGRALQKIVETSSYLKLTKKQ